MKKERNDDFITRTILNKMLEKHGIDVEYVLKHKEIEGLPWYNYYTFTQKEFEEWKIWVMKYLKTTYISKYRHEQGFEMLNLMWGLKIKEDDDTTRE